MTLNEKLKKGVFWEGLNLLMMLILLIYFMVSLFKMTSGSSFWHPILTLVILFTSFMISLSTSTPLIPIQKYLCIGSVERNITQLGTYKGFDFSLFKHSTSKNNLTISNIYILEHLADYILDNFSKELAIITTFMSSDEFKETEGWVQKEYLTKELNSIFNKSFVLFVENMKKKHPSYLDTVRFKDEKELSQSKQEVDLYNDMQKHGTKYSIESSNRVKYGSHYYYDAYYFDYKKTEEKLYIKLTLDSIYLFNTKENIELFLDDKWDYAMNSYFIVKDKIALAEKREQEKQLENEKKATVRKVPDTGFKSAEDMSKHVTQVYDKGDF